MHELGVARGIHRIARRALDPGAEARLAVVRVAVGELSAVEPELLRFAWQAATDGGPDRGSRLEVEWRPARQVCPACGGAKPRPGAGWLSRCPDCGGGLRLEGGSELDVLEVEIEEAVSREERAGP